jgi:hypothetical protein
MLHLYVNFFLSVMKLREKACIDSKSGVSMTTQRLPMHACWKVTTSRTTSRLSYEKHTAT